MRSQRNLFLDEDPMKTAYDLAMKGLLEVWPADTLRDRLSCYAEYESLRYSVSGLERDVRDAG